MWTLLGILEWIKDNRIEVNGKFVPCRPDNWKYRTLSQRIHEAWEVFVGRADAFIWPEGQ